jgi:hypothetical protein
MTPYKEDEGRDIPATDSLMPAVSLLDFAEELLRQPEQQPSGRKSRSPR